MQDSVAELAREQAQAREAEKGEADLVTAARIQKSLHVPAPLYMLF